METITELVTSRIALLKRAIKQAEKAQSSFPEGRLRTSRTGGRLRYYEVNEKGDTNGRYLHKNEMETIKILAQKDYNKHFLKATKTELEILEKFLMNYTSTADDTYNNLIPEKKNLVTPYILSDDLIAQKWQSQIFKPNPYKPENKIHDTKRGEKVRSKSEAFIADTLLELGIPYHYECPVKMVNGEIRYPDFTLLKVKTREVIYFEHFGRMGDEDYRQHVMEKMDLYRDSGIYPGKNLIFTYETEDKPLNIKGMRKMLSELFNQP